VHLAATDPANPYGATLKWPVKPGAGLRDVLPSHAGAAAAASSPAALAARGPTRTVGAGVIIVNGLLAAYIGKADKQFLTFLPDDEPSRSTMARELAGVLFRLATGGSDRAGMLVAEIDGMDAAAHPLAPFLLDAGFVRRPGGFQAAPAREAEGGGRRAEAHPADS
jgi:ATP-dependent Lhr-like helicase